MNRIPSAALAAIFVLSASLSPAFAETAYVSADRSVAVRAAQNQKSRALATLRRNQPVEMEYSGPVWAKVSAGGKTGFVASKFLAAAPDFRQAPKAVAAYAAAALSGRAAFTVPAGAVVPVVSVINKDVLEVEYSGRGGFVRASALPAGPAKALPAVEKPLPQPKFEIGSPALPPEKISAPAASGVLAYWPVFEKLTAALKAHDEKAAQSFSYAAMRCDGDAREMCDWAMGMMADQFSKYAPADFRVLREDAKRAILVAGPKITEPAAGWNGSFRSLLFAKDSEGSWKLLSSAAKSASFPASYSAERAAGELRAKFSDSDSDGVSDADESCSEALSGDSCAATDPKNPDSDGDGVWDGVQAAMAERARAAAEAK